MGSVVLLGIFRQIYYISLFTMEMHPRRFRETISRDAEPGSRPESLFPPALHTNINSNR
jgi:hypothetical protein